jgi:hypothetical protein
LPRSADFRHFNDYFAASGAIAALLFCLRDAGRPLMLPPPTLERPRHYRRVAASAADVV